MHFIDTTIDVTQSKARALLYLFSQSLYFFRLLINQRRSLQKTQRRHIVWRFDF
jgi:hypothetical protein